MFEGAIGLIKKSQKILLLTHKEPDGDALGSLLALSTVLLKLDKKINPILDGKLASNFLFLPGIKMLDTAITTENDLIIMLDLPEIKRSNFLTQIKLMLQSTPSILIDHHPRGDLYELSTFKIHNLEASATSEILYSFINTLAVPISRDIATHLLTGIFTDTNGFQNSNTTPLTFKIASSLISAGARIGQIAQHILYHKSSGGLKLWGRAMQRLWHNKKYNLLVTFLTQEDFLECGVDEDAASGIVNFLNINSFPPANATLLLIEKDGKIKGSLRTQKDSVNVRNLASVLGGGGHKKAAGFEIKGALQHIKGQWKVV